MELKLESDNIEDYLQEVPPIILFDTPFVRNEILTIKSNFKTDFERAKKAFEIARDDIYHSFDSGNEQIYITAEEVLKSKEGICFAKAHLLASLLRGMKIPSGFCYQKVLRNGTLESGYALHGLNAVYLPEIGWFRVDPRGNKPGIDSRFTTGEEHLAYKIRPELGEIDYNVVLIEPLPAVIKAMQESKDCQQLFYARPTDL